jgi:superoxide reductase
MRPLRREEHSGTAKEHEPVLLRTGGGLRVRIGDGSHSRSAAHRIAWIELTCGDLRLRRRLHAGDRPDVVFPVPPGGVTVHALCTRHGLWTSEDADADGRYVLRTGGGRVLRYRRAH